MPFADPEKARAYNAAYYQANKERLRAQNEAWIRDHAEQYKEWKRQYWLKNRERLLAERAEEYKADPTATKARAQQWRLDNPERKREADKAWAKTPAGRALHARIRDRTREKRREDAREYWRKLKITNPEKVKEAGHRTQSMRRARILGAPEIERIERKIVFARDNYICQICKEPTQPNGEDGDRPSVDHIIPLSRGGSHTYANVQTAHLSCNRYKHNKLESEL